MFFTIGMNKDQRCTVTAVSKYVLGRDSSGYASHHTSLQLSQSLEMDDIIESMCESHE